MALSKDIGSVLLKSLDEGVVKKPFQLFSLEGWRKFVWERCPKRFCRLCFGKNECMLPREEALAQGRLIKQVFENFERVLKDEQEGESVESLFQNLEKTNGEGGVVHAIKFREVVMIPRAFLIKHPENEDLLPAHTDEEMQILRNCIESDPESHPFVVLKYKSNNRYLVLNGNSRLSIFEGMDYTGSIPCIIKGHVEDWPAAKQREYMENDALGRRNLTKDQKIEIARRKIARGTSSDQAKHSLGMSRKWVDQHTQEEREVRKEKQLEALKMMREAGFTQKETGETLGIAKRTVENLEKKSRQNGKNSQIATGDAPKPEEVIARAERMLSEENIIAIARERRLKQAESEEKPDIPENSDAALNSQVPRKNESSELKRLRTELRNASDENQKLKAIICKLTAENEELKRKLYGS